MYHFLMKLASEVKSESPLINDKQCIKSTIRRMMNIFIMDLCQYSQAQIDREQFKSIDEVRHAAPVIGLSDDYGKKTTIT